MHTKNVLAFASVTNAFRLIAELGWLGREHNQKKGTNVTNAFRLIADLG